MSDLISRQAAIEAVRAYLSDCCVEDGDYHASGIEYELNNLSSAQPEQRWIPCSERLPETSGTYLVSGMWESGRVAVGDCEYTSYDGYFNTAWNFDVLAWMPLPEPYREGEQDENR